MTLPTVAEVLWSSEPLRLRTKHGVFYADAVDGKIYAASNKARETKHTFEVRVFVQELATFFLERDDWRWC